jgi:hypothetical protein
MSPTLSAVAIPFVPVLGEASCALAQLEKAIVASDVKIVSRTLVEFVITIPLLIAHYVGLRLTEARSLGPHQL